MIIFKGLYIGTSSLYYFCRCNPSPAAFFVYFQPHFILAF
ncbi:unknown [[Mannheimia] succiniciproducens MBEL55E]|uniref:Uncharacterized protein n=1 Tax=Mannheimia succiniciproducens (strain KCTC 0769BP / MBEL55E) TaxID=221988 RepID=Q65S24_MANSM|nr:unknown [[Mannheimia] succiniciproducens MBEL55E]